MSSMLPITRTWSFSGDKIGLTDYNVEMNGSTRWTS